MIRTPYENDPQDATTPVDGMDIVEMLRNPALTNCINTEIMNDAADEIESLRQQNKELRKAMNGPRKGPLPVHFRAK